MTISERHKKAMAALAAGAFIPALPLALNKERRFDERRQRELIRYYLDCGADGIAAAVHSTQFEIRLPRYSLLGRVISVCVTEIDRYEKETGRIIIRIAGVCGGTEQAVREAQAAAALGYDAVLLSPGGLGGMGDEDMLDRARAVAAIIPVVGFYLQPKVGGRRFGYDFWRGLFDIPGVCAVKCASFDRYSTLDVVRAAASSRRAGEIALYTGNDDHIVLDFLTPFRFGGTEVRFTGGLLGHWAVWTRKAVEIFREVKNGRATPSLMTLAAEVTDMNAAVFDAANDFRGCIPGINEVLRREGLLDSALCLDPALTLSPGQPEEIDRVYRMYPHLTE